MKKQDQRQASTYQSQNQVFIQNQQNVVDYQPQDNLRILDCGLLQPQELSEFRVDLSNQMIYDTSQFSIESQKFGELSNQQMQILAQGQIQIYEPQQMIISQQDDFQSGRCYIQKKLKKNTNVPKAIGRYMTQYYNQYRYTIFKDEQDFYQKIEQKLQTMKNWIRQSKKNSCKLIHLKQLFSQDQLNKKQSILMRLMMRKILQNYLRKQIIPNKQVKDKLQYLITTKVFSIRSSNPRLASRTQIK